MKVHIVQAEHVSGLCVARSHFYLTIFEMQRVVTVEEERF